MHLQLECIGIRVVERNLGCVDINPDAQSALVLWGDADIAQLSKVQSVEQRRHCLIDKVGLHVTQVASQCTNVQVALQMWQTALSPGTVCLFDCCAQSDAQQSVLCNCHNAVRLRASASSDDLHHTCLLAA